MSELLAWLDEPEQGAGRDHWLSAFRAGALPMLRAEHAVETIGNLVDATCTASGTNTWDCTAYDTPATNSAIVSGREEVERTVRLRAGSFSVERSL